MTKAVTLAELADQNVLSVDGANNRVGIASTQPTATLDVAGIVSATSFYGSGANLTALNGTAIASGTVAAARVATLNQNTTGTAGGLSGTPNIAISNSTGVAATFTSNVTIGGTLTSDRMLVGTTSNVTGDLVQIKNTGGEGIGFYRNSSANDIVNGRLQFRSSIDITSSIEGGHDGSQSAGNSPGRLVFKTTASSATSPTERLRITSNGGVRFAGGPLEEKIEERSNDVGDDANFNVMNGNILAYTGAANAAGARTINIRGNASTAYNDIAASDHVVSLTVIHRPNSNDYINAYTVDGNANGQNSYSISIQFLGGSAPSSASASAYEVHNITLIKSADKSYQFLVAVSEYA